MNHKQDQGRPDSSMNILFMADYFLPHAGGSRVYYYNLYSRLVNQFSDRLTILTKEVPGWRKFDSALSNKNFRILRQFKPLPNLQARHLPKIVFPLLGTLGLVASGSVDIIHPGDLYPQGVIARWMKQILGIPFIAYCHGEDITQTDQYRYQPTVRDWIYHGADRVVAACEFARENLLRIGVEEKRIVKITPGVDFHRFAPRTVKEELVRSYGVAGKRVLLTVARLFPRKGHEAVIRAVAGLIGEFPDLIYLVVGLGPEQKRLESLVSQLGLRERIKFTGYIAEDELPAIYNMCDVFVMPNSEENGDIEGFGMVFLEANAAGKPVIAGKSGGTEDSVLDGVTGFRIDPNNLDELTAAVRRLLADNELRTRIGQAGLDRARREFDWNDRAAELRRLSLEIVEEKKREKRAAQSGLRSLMLR